MTWKLARRTERMNPSVIREILKLTQQPGIISFAGGLPSPKTFPVEAMREAAARVLSRDGHAALQYAASEGFEPLREWVAHDLRKLGWQIAAQQVLITTGSQQGLDLVAKVLIDAESEVLVETPTYLGALQAFTPMEPRFVGVPSDAQGVQVPALQALAQSQAARLLYLLPNFQNPTGHCMSQARRDAVVEVLARTGLPLVEDNPYGDLWFDTPPPAALGARLPEQSIYLGSFSKTLAPGLRLGFVVAPQPIYAKLLQAKQAADLHTPGFNQRLVAEVIRDGFMDKHVPGIRALYQRQCQVMQTALEREMAGLDVRWNQPAGGMFLWLQLPPGLDAMQLLPHALQAGVAFVPGAAFYAQSADTRYLRLSFVTASETDIATGIAALAKTVREQCEVLKL